MSGGHCGTNVEPSNRIGDDPSRRSPVDVPWTTSTSIAAWSGGTPWLRVRFVSGEHPAWEVVEAHFEGSDVITWRIGAMQVSTEQFREHLCLDATEVIERRCGVLTPIDPVREESGASQRTRQGCGD